MKTNYQDENEIMFNNVKDERIRKYKKKMNNKRWIQN